MPVDATAPPPPHVLVASKAGFLPSAVATVIFVSFPPLAGLAGSGSFYRYRSASLEMIMVPRLPMMHSPYSSKPFVLNDS